MANKEQPTATTDANTSASEPVTFAGTFGGMRRDLIAHTERTLRRLFADKRLLMDDLPGDVTVEEVNAQVCDHFQKLHGRERFFYIICLKC